METIYKQDVFFIINPAAQNAGSLKVWRYVEKKLISEKIPYRSFFTEYKGHAQELTERILLQHHNKVIIAAVGGDGTLHEVMNGAVRFPNASVISIPAGSGNDYARGIQGTADLKQAMSILMDHSDKNIHHVDVGEFETPEQAGYFINSIGIGIDAEITWDVNRSSSKKWFNFIKLGKLVYIYFFIKKLLTYKRIDMKIIMDGKELLLKKVWFVVVSNQPYFGGGIKISPHSVPDDGRFNLIAVHDISHLKLLSVFLTVFWGGHLRIKNVDSYLCRNVQMESANPVHIQADGEIVGKSAVAVNIAPQQIRVHR
jgi:diacylglycerol kinase (ATP)